MARIFISYARKHEAFARQLATSLSDAGADVWLDIEDIPAGMNWSSAIQEGLDACEVMLVIITPESMASKNVENEWQYYLDEGKVVIPVLLEQAKVHFQIRRLQYIDFLAQNYETAFAQLHSELRRKGADLRPISTDDRNITLPVKPPLPQSQEAEVEDVVPPKQRTGLIISGIAALLIVILAIIALNRSILDLPATPIPDSLRAALERAQNFSGGNRDWQPYATVFPDDPTGAEMMLVPVGEFMMGSEDGDDDEKPVHKQTFDAPFWIDRTEVTRAMYAQCAAAGECTTTPENEYSTQDSQPINRVTWFQARDYCEWRGARLPTEREWEYAARGPDNWNYPWGNGFIVDNAIYEDNSNNVTANVGAKLGSASWVGALDMSGNVWEWVSSIYALYPYKYDDGRESKVDIEGTRVLRGGAFGVGVSLLSITYRNRYSPTGELGSWGFRCAYS